MAPNIDDTTPDAGEGIIARLWKPPRPLFYSAFTVDISVACIGLALQFLGISLGASPLILGLLGTLATLGYAVSCLFSGTVSDRFGRKRSAFIGLGISSAIWVAYTFAPNPYVLLALVPFAGMGLALFWPSIQAWMVELTTGGRRGLTRNIGLFNLFWCAGVMVGPTMAGQTWDLGHSLPFWLSAALVWLVMITLIVTPRGEVAEKDDYNRSDTSGHDVPEKIWPMFMRVAWFGLFGSWFLGATMRTMFPKLAHEISIGPKTVGWVMT
ncbi:MAG: MFS transporter, partial [Armatimonadota bacterium]